MEQSIKMLLLS